MARIALISVLAAQTTLTSIEANDREAKNILERSEGNDSQVAQLQSAIQMLGLLHHNLVGITQTVNGQDASHPISRQKP